jgi:hypothetical protein
MTVCRLFTAIAASPADVPLVEPVSTSWMDRENTPPGPAAASMLVWSWALVLPEKPRERKDSGSPGTTVSTKPLNMRADRQ